MAFRINGPPEIAPLASNADVGFIDMPIDAGTAEMLLGTLGQFRAELLDPAIRCRAVNRDVTLRQ